MVKRLVLLTTIIASATLTGGCVRERRAEVVYSPVPASLAPVSDTGATRVYLDHESDRLTDTELSIAKEIGGLLQGQGIDTASNNIRAIVNKGVVTLQGTVPTSNLRRELEDRISIMSGVKRVVNELEVELK